MYNLRMNVSTIIELVGYTGSLLVIISMLMTSLTKLRVVNSIGCIVFATYALIIKSYPTAAMQACLLIINCIGLYNLSKNKKQYSITELKNGATDTRPLQILSSTQITRTSGRSAMRSWRSFPQRTPIRLNPAGRSMIVFAWFVNLFISQG